VTAKLWDLEVSFGRHATEIEQVRWGESISNYWQVNMTNAYGRTYNQYVSVKTLVGYIYYLISIASPGDVLYIPWVCGKSQTLNYNMQPQDITALNCAIKAARAKGLKVVMPYQFNWDLKGALLVVTQNDDGSVATLTNNGDWDAKALNYYPGCTKFGVSFSTARIAAVIEKNPNTITYDTKKKPYTDTQCSSIPTASDGSSYMCEIVAGGTKCNTGCSGVTY